MIVIITITIPITVHQRDSSGETRVGSIIAALSAQREPDGLPPMMTLFIFIITTTAVIIYIIIIIIFTKPYAAAGLVSGQDTAQAGTFSGVLNVSLCASCAQLGLEIVV